MYFRSCDFLVQVPGNPASRLYARIRLLADVLVGAADIHSLIGLDSPFTGTTALAIAADGGVQVRAFSPLALRGESGYLHSGFTARHPDVDLH